MKKEFVFLFVASLKRIVTANEEWMQECKNQSENIQIHSADGNWRNLTSDETSNQYFWIERTFTCTADPDHFALVRINHNMDFPSETKTITCGSRRKWMYKGEVVFNVGCYTGTRADWIQKSEEEERIRNWMGEHHGAKEDQKDWTWGSTQYEQQKKMQRMASEIQNLLVNTDNIIRKQVAVVPADYVNAFWEGWSFSEDNYYMRTGFFGFEDDNSVLEFENYVIFVFRGGFRLPERSKPDTREEISRYFQDTSKSRERHDGIQSLAVHLWSCGGHFAFVQINDQMDSPSDTKTIGCGQKRKWLHKGEVVVTVGCYTGPRKVVSAYSLRAFFITKFASFQRIRSERLKLAVRLPKSIAPVRPRFRLVSKASDISLKEILSRDAAGEILERFCKDQNFLKQTDDEGNTMLHLVIKFFGAERITYRPIGVPVWKRISNHLIYDFPPDNDGLPDSIYRGDLSSYPSDALNSHSPYGPTMDIESEDEDETFREFFEDYHLRHFSTFLKNGDEHFAENVISCANYPKSDLLYGVFRIKQAYVNRGVGFELPPPELCGNDKRPKKLFRIDAQITSGQSFLHTLKAIADGITKNETIKGNPMISFTKPKRDGFVHPIGAFMAYGIHEKYDVEENAVSDYARMQNGNMFFAFRGSQENDRFAYSHATFLWTAEETVLVGDKKVTKQIPLPFIYNVDFLLHEKDQMNSEPITSDEILDIINHKPKQMSLGGIRLELKWDSWSCCSACCDKLDWESWHATNCHDVLSYRTRRGLYHFTKINDAELRKNDSKELPIYSM
ncbi:unnamed protein product, partial [Mesorhabditis belari]|uniref:Uncharacterized protein n=1 Tax=Mesorhabditis belari TaxID=2138241 RepID=A0AAF3FAJ1_9BILA